MAIPKNTIRKIAHKQKNPNGLHKRYRVSKLGGKTDPAAEYFVLRLDEKPEYTGETAAADRMHMIASRAAVRLYASIMKAHIPKMQEDLDNLFPAIQQ